ncbi:MAG: TonB-dependent receptor domain-containing protein [Bryobacteraceae bacterium]
MMTAFLRLLVMLTCPAVLALAQSPTATLVGRVVDATGGLIPAAEIQVRNVDTGELRRVTGTAEAEYTVPNLPPGVYEVTVTKAGFRTHREENLELQVDQTARLEIKLEVGAVADAIEVTAEAPVVNTENASRGEVIASQELVDVPLNGRDFNDLAFLVPGVARAAQGSNGSSLAINGARPDNSNFVIDGFNDHNPRMGQAQARPPLDSIQEFKMQVTGYSAENGRLAGGVMNMALRTGGNQPHGTLFEFLRNDLFDARNFFDAGKSKLRRNQFGGTLSGPVFVPRVYNGRNRTFFLMSWESYRQSLGVTKLGRVPTELERAGDFSQTLDAQGKPALIADPFSGGTCSAKDSKGCFPGNRIPASRLNPVAQKLMTFYPMPNRPGQANNIHATANDTDAWNSYLGKIDQRVSEKDSLSFRVLARFNSTQNPFSGDGLGSFGRMNEVVQSLIGANYMRIFSPTLINELRAGFSRTRQNNTANGIGAGFEPYRLAGASTDPVMGGFPRISIRDLITLGPPGSQPTQSAVTNYQVGDTLTLVRTRHMVKAGFEVIRNHFFQPYNNNVRGTANFLGRWTNDPTADFVLGLPNSTSRQVGIARNYLYTSSYGFFVQDDFRATSRLTLNLGLRYEIMKPPREKYGRWTNFAPEYGKLIIAEDGSIPNLAQLAESVGLAGKYALARDLGLPSTLVYTNYRSFAPRFGLAWRPFGGTRSVLRAGYGIFYGGTAANSIRNDLGNTFPFAMSESFNRSTRDPSALTLSAPFPSALGRVQGVNNANAYEIHPSPQYLQGWNATIEHELYRSVALEAAYVGSKGTHLARKYNINQPFRRPELQLPGGGFPRPFQEFNNISMYSFGSNSIYNAGMLSLRKRFSKGSFFRLNYVYSKSIDSASQADGAADGGFPGAQDARNLGLERGRSDWDNGHAVTMNFVSELPWMARNRWLGGWQLAGSGRLYTGQPFTLRTANAQEDQGEATRPDRVRKGTVENPTADRWYDVAAFPLVPAGSYRFGNSGRNVLDGPGFAGVNLSMMKKFRVRERDHLQFRWEVFNVVNHANLELPVNDVDLKNAGTIVRADPARIMQFGLKYVF